MSVLINMEAVIKSDPDGESSGNQPCVLLEGELSEQNSVPENKIHINSNIERKVFNETEKLSTASGKPVYNDEWSLNTKKSLLHNFKQFGCSRGTLENFASTYSVNTQLAIDYFEKSAKDAQDFVYEECDSLSFNNVTEWLKYFQLMGGPKECNYEAAIILNGIANNECHPKPELMNGIDLNAIYRFISYGLLGLPQEQLNAASAKFLSNEFQRLINEANTDEADIDVRDMKRKVEDSIGNNIDGKIYSESLSLDPLNIGAWCFGSTKK